MSPLRARPQIKSALRKTQIFMIIFFFRERKVKLRVERLPRNNQDRYEIKSGQKQTKKLAQQCLPFFKTETLFFLPLTN